MYCLAMATTSPELEGEEDELAEELDESDEELESDEDETPLLGARRSRSRLGPESERSEDCSRSCSSWAACSPRSCWSCSSWAACSPRSCCSACSSTACCSRRSCAASARRSASRSARIRSWYGVGPVGLATGSTSTSP